MSSRIAVVIPVKNEMKLGFLPKIIKSLSGTPGLEVLWVASPHSDGTSEFLLDQKQKVLFVDSDSRASRLNQGIKQAQSERILLHHPRSVLQKGALNELVKFWQDRPNAWGGFTHSFFNNEHALLKFTSWYSNRVRFDGSGIIYLDHCLFFPKKLISSLPAMPEVDIFEDTLLSQRLLRSSRPVRLKTLSKTSAVRFEANGIWRQAIMNQVLKLGYKLNISDQCMNKIYEKGLNLNTSYKVKKQSNLFLK